MKTYKLIKTYPSSDELGAILKPKMVDGKPHDYYFKSNWIDPSEYPDFWEEVRVPLFTTLDNIDIFEEDDYYLVSNDFTLVYCSSYSEKDLEFKLFYSREKAQEYIKNNKTIDFEILTVNPSAAHNSYPDKSITFTWREVSQDFKFWDIHSVKRLSDGEIFTIGDKLSGHEGTIDVIKTSINNVIWLSTDIELSYGWLLEHAVKEDILYTKNELLKVVEHWGLCTVEIEHINKFLNR